MVYDVLVIGGGFSGLAAGVRLAYFGKKVVLLEKHKVMGGLNSFYKRGGHHLDTGLHAMTNYISSGYRGARVPLQRICRQLRISLESLNLEPQSFSEIRFGDAQLRFGNDIGLLEEEIRRSFPDQMRDFAQLKAVCENYPNVASDHPPQSTRDRLRELIGDALLREMLLAPILFYGSAQENDIDFDQFIVLFKSIYQEGFSRPKGGSKYLIQMLIDKFAEHGGELRKSCGVACLEVRDGQVQQVLLENGQALCAKVIISSAGLVETMNLRSDQVAQEYAHLSGQLGFLETIWVLDQPVKDLGHNACITFFNDGPVLDYAAPEAMVDVRSGIICCPNNYGSGEGHGEPMLRATHLASWKKWMVQAAQAPWPVRTEQYQDEKRAWSERSKQVISRYVGDFASHVVFTDSFTPSTVRHFTNKVNGAIYGTPNKVKTGRTDLSNLFLCGSDQGMVGIVGAILSGIHIANTFGLSPIPGQEAA